MKSYTGTKTIMAEPMSEGEAVVKGYARPTEDEYQREGYHVQYTNPDGSLYDSWSPKYVFEKTYTINECLDACDKCVESYCTKKSLLEEINEHLNAIKDIIVSDKENTALILSAVQYDKEKKGSNCTTAIIGRNKNLYTCLKAIMNDKEMMDIIKMETEKLQINLADGINKAEVILREGAAVKELEPKAPIKTSLSGVIGAPVEYLTKRVATGQFTQERSHLIVNREEIKLSLIINEDDEYQRGQIDGTLEFHPKFVEFGINTGKVWTPTELGMFFKMNRAFFPDRSVNMKLVSELMNFSATVNNKIERSLKENGDRTDNFAQVVNSNLPASFVLNIPIFKGLKSETLEIETFAKINGREVAFILLSPSANQTLEDIRDKAIDEQLSQIKEIAPNIAIIEV